MCGTADAINHKDLEFFCLSYILVILVYRWVRTGGFIEYILIQLGIGEPKSKLCTESDMLALICFLLNKTSCTNRDV